ncbi:MAG: HutD family protein [Phycisphaerales bacterium]|nr:HutD family protein [Phycisphaerales bacterium]
MPLLLPASSHRRVPWRNGGGVTDEIAVQPDPCDPSRFAWRISIATIGSAGPFSLFPGVDRILLLVDGHGMLIRIGDGAWQRIDRPFEPLDFAGEVPVDCRLIDGPVHDLNVMVDRMHWRALVRTIRRPGDGVAGEAAAARFLVAFHGTVRIGWGDTPFELAHRDALRLDQGEVWSIAELDAGASLVEVALDPV